MGTKSSFSGFRLPPGYRFHPTDVELVMYYLKRKVLGKKILDPQAIADVDIYKYAPWDLPLKSCLGGKDLKWYFFCPAEKKYASGGRMKRSTNLGYWKTTGKDRPVHYNKEVVGMIKTLVFHRGKAPNGDRTDWVIYEYRLKDKSLDDQTPQDSYVLCSLFEKDGPGPKNGAQYGAPFKEEEWEDEEEEEEEEVVVEERNIVETGASAGFADPTFVIPRNQSISTVVVEAEGDSAAGIPAPVIASSSMQPMSNPFDMVPSAGITPVVSNNGIMLPHMVSGNANTLPGTSVPMVPEAQVGYDDVVSAMLSAFTDESDWNMNTAEITDMTNHGGTAGADTQLDGNDIYSGLGDLSDLTRFDGGHTANNFSTSYVNGDYMELTDLIEPLDADYSQFNSLLD